MRSVPISPRTLPHTRTHQLRTYLSSFQLVKRTFCVFSIFFIPSHGSPRKIHKWKRWRHNNVYLIRIECIVGSRIVCLDNSECLDHHSVCFNGGRRHNFLTSQEILEQSFSTVSVSVSRSVKAFSCWAATVSRFSCQSSTLSIRLCIWCSEIRRTANGMLSFSNAKWTEICSLLLW